MKKYILSVIILILVVSINTYSQCGMMGAGSGSHNHGNKASSSSHDHNQQKDVTKGYAFINDDGMQEATILIKKGYQPDTLVVKKGIPLRLKFDLQEEGCTATVSFVDFDVKKLLTPYEVATVEFTPDSSGPFTFACPMNMIEGTLVVKK